MRLDALPVDRAAEQVKYVTYCTYVDMYIGKQLRAQAWPETVRNGRCSRHPQGSLLPLYLPLYLGGCWGGSGQRSGRADVKTGPSSLLSHPV